MKLSVILPVFKSKATICQLYERVTHVIRCMPDFPDHEIIFVEDCGHDGSWDLIQELASQDGSVLGIQFSRNFGQHHGITAGIDLCSGDWAVVMDCDLQDTPEAIPDLWRKAQEGFEIVHARRQGRKDAFLKSLRSRVYHWVLEWLSGLGCDPQVANYRIVSRQVLEAFKSLHETSRAFGPQLQWLGYPSATIDVAHQARPDGKTSYTWTKLFRLALDIAVSYSSKPLRISIFLGLGMAFASVVTACWYALRALIWSVPVQGWSSLMVSVWFLGGVVLSNLGIIGIYIGKIFDEVRGRPLYVISRRVNC